MLNIPGFSLVFLSPQPLTSLRKATFLGEGLVLLLSGLARADFSGVVSGATTTSGIGADACIWSKRN